MGTRVFGQILLDSDSSPTHSDFDSDSTRDMRTRTSGLGPDSEKKTAHLKIPFKPATRGAATLQKLGGSESGEARNEGAKRPIYEGEARIEGEARERAGGGVWGGGSVSPSPEKFWNFELQIVQSGVYLKWIFQIN